MATHRLLRTIRIMLMGAFVLSLPLATAHKDSVSAMADVLRYATPVLLALALLAGFAERRVRLRHGIPARWLWDR